MSFQINAFNSNSNNVQESHISIDNSLSINNSPLKFGNDERFKSSKISDIFTETKYSNQSLNFPYNFNNPNKLKILLTTFSKNENIINPIKFKSDGQLNNLLSNENSNEELKTFNLPLCNNYDITIKGIDTQILIDINKEILEKRKYEEMKEYLNERGTVKPRFKDETEKKFELKKLINFYEKSSKERQEENSGFVLENLSLKNNNSSPGPIITKKDSIFLKFFNSKNFLEINSTDSFTLCSNIKINNLSKSDCNIKKDPNHILKNRIRNSNKLYDNFNRLNFNNVKNYQTHESKNQKENDFSINRNINKQNLIKITIKFNDFDMVRKNSDKFPQMKKSLEPLPKDPGFLLKTHDKIFESRHNFPKLIHAREIENEKDDYKFIINPMSFHDNVSINAISVSPTGNMYTNGYATGFDFTYKNSDNCDNENFNFNSFATSKNNFLVQRRTVSFNNKGFLNNNNHLLTHKQKLRKNNFNFSHDAIKKAFLPPTDDKKYPKYYLPQPGFGLLTRTNIKIEK